MTLDRNGPARDKDLDEAVAAYLDAADQGRAPDRGEWLKRYPDLAAELAEIFAAFDCVDRLASPLLGATDFSLGVAKAGAKAATPDTVADGGPARPAAAGKQFGDYEILEGLGSGGMGVVFRARHRTLNRVVALKMIRSGAWATEAEAVRFRNEAETAASLDHPNIVPVYEAGFELAQLFFTMRLVEGASLAADPARYRGRPREAAALMAVIARAVHYAHQRGVLHRDLKPSNILVDRDGVPYVTDFGLAKRLGANPTLTLSGAVVGTPGFLAPEQTTGSGAATVAGDVFSLGALLYSLIAGVAPFQGSSVLETLERTRTGAVPSLRGGETRVDRDLDTVCRKCLEKDPARRYRSAEDLAADLERWLAGKPVEAKRPSARRRLVLWCIRNPAAAALVAAVTVLSPLLIAALIAGVVVVSQERDAARLQRQKARDQLYAADMGRAFVAWKQGDSKLLGRLLDDWRPAAEPGDLRDFSWRFLQRLRTGGRSTPTAIDAAHQGPIYRMSFSPDGRTLATASQDGSVRLRDDCGRATYLRRHTLDVNWVAFDRTGERLVSAGDNREARLWDAKSGRELAAWDVPGGEIVAAEFSRDGTLLFTASHDGHLQAWDIKGRVPVGDLAVRPTRIQGLAVSPGGRQAAVVTEDGHLDVVDVPACQLRFDRDLYCGGCCVAYSPDGTRLAVGDGVGNLRIYRAIDGFEEATYSFERGGTEGVAFSPDGRSLAACGRHGQVRLLDLETGSPQMKLDAGEVRLWCVTFSWDGRRLLVGGEDGAVRTRDLAGTAVPAYLPPPAGETMALDFARSGDTLALLSGRGTVSLWDPHTMQERKDTEPPRCTGGGSICFDSAGNLGVGIPAPGEIQVFEPTSQRLVARKKLPAGQCLTSLRSRPGATEWTVSVAHGSLYRWDSATDREISSVFSGKAGCYAAWSPNGSTLAATVGDPGKPRLFVPSTNETRDFPDARSPEGGPLAFSPDGAVLATNLKGLVRLRDVKTSDLYAELAADKSSVRCMAFSPDGKILATAGDDTAIRLWHVKTGRELFALPARRQGCARQVAFSPDGTVLVAVYEKALRGECVAAWEAVAP